MKTICLLTFIILLAGCSPSAKERNDFTVLPEGLSDCKIYSISNGIGEITVVRCPNSSTTAYKGGKYSRTSVTIEK